jgi:hypothetical protein
MTFASFFMKRIYICLPFDGEIEDLLALAQEMCHRVIDAGHEPFSPHLSFPEILDMDDSKKISREHGLQCALSVLETCDEVWAFVGEGETVPVWPPHLGYALSIGKHIEIIRG